MLAGSAYREILQPFLLKFLDSAEREGLLHFQVSIVNQDNSFIYKQIGQFVSCFGIYLKFLLSTCALLLFAQLCHFRTIRNIGGRGALSNVVFFVFSHIRTYTITWLVVYQHYQHVEQIQKNPIGIYILWQLFSIDFSLCSVHKSRQNSLFFLCSYKLELYFFANIKMQNN